MEQALGILIGGALIVTFVVAKDALQTWWRKRH